MKSINNKITSALILLLLLSSTLLSGILVPVSASEQGNQLETEFLTGGLYSSNQTNTDFVDNKVDIQLLSTDETGLSYKVRVPWRALSLEPITVDDKAYIKSSIPGWLETLTAGEPALPVHVEKLGVPLGAIIEISVIPGTAHIHKLSAPVLPVVTQEAEADSSLDLFEHHEESLTRLIYQEDPSIYEGNGPYPGILAEITGDGILRQQRVVGITAYPVQYEPHSDELIIYESLLINVKFVGSPEIRTQLAFSDSPQYESFFKEELLNYETARNYRMPNEVSAIQQETESYEINAGGASIPWQPPDPGYRIKVQEEGMYRITYAELANPALGIPVDSLDPRSFQILNLGTELAIQVVGEDDGVFDSTDSIIFYGQGLESQYTQDNVYWLTYDSAEIIQGKRIESQDGTPGTASTPEYYSSVRHMESNSYHLSWLPFDEGTERWWWEIIQAPTYSTSWTHSFSLVEPYSGSIDPEDDPAQLTVSLVGYTSNYVIFPDHHVRVFVNSQDVGDIFFDGREWNVSSFPINQGILNPGSNSIELRSINDTGATSDWFLIDWLQIDYPNTFHADSNELNFNYKAPGTWNYVVEGFTSNQVDVYDITDPSTLVNIENVSVTSFEGDYAAQFQDTISEPTRYWAMTDTTYRTVEGIEADFPSTLGSTSNGADHIVITHADFSTQALALSNHRSTTMRAITVDVQDIYDEFNYGIEGAVPIRNFLAYTYANWQVPAPSYVVLVGDGHFDPKENLYTGITSYIPAYLLPVDPWIGETASDNRYVTLVGEDTLPDMMIGRLAVNSAAEASAFITKIINYETTPVSGDWQQQVLAIADNADLAGDFAAISENLLNLYVSPVSPPYSSEKVYYGVTHDLASAKQAIVDEINSGKLIVNYIGHSGFTAWGDQLFKASQVAGLSNGSKLPVMLDMTCYDGSFHYPDIDALAEVISRADGKGTVANWSSTGEGVASGHDFLNRGFFEAFFQDGLVTVGDATTTGKFFLWSAGGALDLLDTYTLFGDPALVIVRPETTNHPPVIVEGSSVKVAMSEDGSPIGFSLTLNATDIDGDTLNWGGSGDTHHGIVVASGTGNSIAIGYTPDASYFGSDTFVIQVSDGTLMDQIVVNVIIEPVNDPPEAVNDNISTNPNTPVNMTTDQLKANDTDIDNTNSELGVIEVSNPTNGTVILENGLVTFTPSTDFIGTAGFDYTLSDGELTDIGHVTVNVFLVNTPPIAVDDAYIVEKGQILTIPAPGVLSNDYDSGSVPLTAVLISSTSQGTLTLNSDGSFTYTPKSNFTGTDSFTYVAYDGVYYSNQAMVTINVVTNVVEISIPLQVGWNLISFNLQPPSTAVEDVLSNIEGSYTLVYAWDAVNDAWLLYDPSAPPYANDLQNLELTMGFWVYLTTTDTLVLSGTAPTTTNIPLNAGWNLVGYPSIDPLELPGALTDNGVTDYSLVMAYHANDADPWKLFDPTAPSYSNDLIEMTHGWGYWIDVDVDSTWAVTYDLP